MIPNKHPESSFQALGFPPPQPTAVIRMACEFTLIIYQTEDDYLQFFIEAEMKNIIPVSALEFAGASMLAVDERIRNEDTGYAMDVSETYICTIKRPPHLNAAQYAQE
ncbi:hypothetical protein K438DRAFT_1772204 [Mycena galopus ATCC 62051]|nr:hypothetical protein K438DRAFT_1772204 [Mycena galopus ATCC 62051]